MLTYQLQVEKWRVEKSEGEDGEMRDIEVEAEGNETESDHFEDFN